MAPETPARSTLRTRVFSLATLVGTAAFLGWIGREVYLAITDSFCAPIILSPDNDMIVQSKLKVAEFYVEREKSVAERDAIDADITAIDASIAELEALRRTTDDALAFTSEVNAHKLAAAGVDLDALKRAHELLTKMLEEQRVNVATAKANMDAGVATKVDYERERQGLDQLELGLVENERTQAQTVALAAEARFERRSLSTPGAPMMPERWMREEQRVRIGLELTKLQADRRTKVSERRLLVDKLGVLDGLERDLKSRPIFRAVDKSVDAAFVPYTQMGELRVGWAVYACVGGLVACKEVGVVTEIVPGEVILPDPWGNQARGQYVVLELSDRSAMMSKTLRLRNVARSSKPLAPPTPDKVSSR